MRYSPNAALEFSSLAFGYYTKGHGIVSLFRCGFDEKLRCDPQACEPQPMMKRMLAIRR